MTFSSGPTNSLRGASELTKLKDAIVVDIGGTSTDVAMLSNGFPRPASAYVNIGGVRTNFRMPDTYCIGLGGGSVVEFNQDGVKIGPQSVGYKLKKEARCFGGSILTATDVAMAAGLAHINGADPSKVGLNEQQIKMALKEICRLVEEAVDKIKTSESDLPLVLVGGGSILIPDGVKLKGISQIIKPEHFGCANALGAAIS